MASISRSSILCRDCCSTPAMAAAMRSSAVPNAPAAAQAEPPPGVGDAEPNAASTSFSDLSANEATGECGRCRRSAGPECEDLVVVVALFLLADVVERVAERLDGRLDRGLDVAPFQLHAVDLALDVLEARLRAIEQQLRTAFGVAHDAVGFLLRGALQIFRQLLRGHERRSQVLLVLAMFGEHGFHAREVLPQAVGLTQGLLVVVGDGGQERRDLDPVETPEAGVETLLTKVKRTDIHAVNLRLHLSVDGAANLSGGRISPCRL